MSSRARSKVDIRYRFDDANRLMVSRPGGVGDSLRPVRIIEGRVTTDRRNRLVYRLDFPPTTNGPAGPRRYNLDGTWGLTRNHELRLALHTAERRRRQTVYLKGSLIEAKAHALTFALWRYERDGRRTTQRVSLTGRWQADRHNRLTFLVEKADGSADRLTFQSGWTVGRHHELLYRYRQRTDGRGRPSTQTLRFAGVWDINRANRLIYRVDGSSDSAFEFRASLQTPSLNAREGRLVYQIGIGLSGGRTQTERVVLFGKWKLHRDLSVSFEITYAHGRREAIRFTGTFAITEQDEMTVQLSDRRGRPIGVSVTFTRRLLDDARLFLKLRKAGEEAEAVAGGQVRF